MEKFFTYKGVMPHRVMSKKSMDFNRRHPKCSECHTPISFKQGFAMWNPWRFKCPSCHVLLETSYPTKITFIFAIPLGCLLGGIPIYFEKIGLWVKTHSLLYFAFLILAILGVSYMLWPFTVFQLKRPKA
jgi:hypothetical protein